MKDQNELEKYKKSAKKLTLFGAVLLSITTLLSVLQVVYLIALRNTDLSKIKELTDEQAANIKSSVTNSTILFFGAVALVYLLFTVCMYVFSSRIKKDLKISVIPYYGAIVLVMYSFLQSALAVNLFNAVLYLITGVVTGIALVFVYQVRKM
ncbi:hypothetical protein ACWOFR_00255 [Carnobacterium gallinarum]|uniref:hypothetical protein n=1 Tax=Carnobacterium gallinarum TaxID=2749 RepID=UPI00054F8146|nr:hypothetical protein [Carnobacterium gallinarum]